MVSDRQIGMKIRELRKAAGLDVDTLGSAIGRSGKTVSAWETGRNIPSADMLITICRYFKVNISDFYPPDVSATETSLESEPVLTQDEQKLVDLYRLLSDEQKSIIMSTAENFAVASEKDAAGKRVDVRRVGVDA